MPAGARSMSDPSKNTVLAGTVAVTVHVTRWPIVARVGVTVLVIDAPAMVTLELALTAYPRSFGLIGASGSVWPSFSVLPVSVAVLV